MDDDLAHPRYGRHNAGDGIAFTRSARKHRVSHDDMRAVLRAPRAVVDLEPATPHLDKRRLYLGDGRSGNPLEVVAIVRADDSLLVIHAMPLRSKFRTSYEGS